VLGRSKPSLATLLAAASVLTAAALVIAGCSSGGLTEATHSAQRRAAPSAAPGAPPSQGATQASPLSSPAPPPVPPPPPEHGCYQLQFDELAQSASLDDPLPCEEAHDAQTIYVGRLGSTAGVDSTAARAQMARVCPRRLKHYLGGSRTDRHLSRFNVVWFVPTPEQAAAGARWFRCDAIAFAGPNHLYPLPRPHRLHGILDHAHARDTFGLCGTAAPGSPGFQRVICARHHRWRAESTIHLAGGDRYPGRRAVRKAGDSICRDRARAANGYSLRFRYGWEWPNRQQWGNGQHYGFCWLPD
jgi:hypothetical protein